MAGKETILDASGHHFSWVSENFYEQNSLFDIMREWRWSVFEDPMENGDITSIEFIGEKSGDDLILFEALAPFVEAGSFIEMIGEDGYHWRWFFDGKTCEEQEGTVTYK